MATKGKLTEESITGYVSNVSPVKEAQNKKTKYFTAEVQTSKSTTHRLICFLPEKHQSFVTAGGSDSPFMLKNARLQPGRDQALEVKAFKDVELVQARKLTFSKEYSMFIPEPETEACTVEEMVKEEYKLEAVNVKFCGFIEREREVMTRYGPKKIWSGHSSSAKIVVWSEAIKDELEVSQHYKITGLQNRTFDSQCQLNTTSTTKVTSITPLAKVAESNMAQYFESDCEISVQSVQVTEHTSCAVCFKTVDGSEAIVRCLSCKHKQLRKNLISRLSVIVCVTEDNTVAKKSISQEALQNFLKEENKLKLLNDADALQDFIIILSSPFKCSILPNQIISKMVRLTESS